MVGKGFFGQYSNQNPASSWPTGRFRNYDRSGAIDYGLRICQIGRFADDPLRNGKLVVQKPS